VKVLYDREALSGGSGCNAVWLNAFGVKDFVVVK
jgi:hypothetical protein